MPILIFMLIRIVVLIQILMLIRIVMQILIVMIVMLIMIFMLILIQSVTNIFEYSNIRIYLLQIFIWTFVLVNFFDANIFGHSFVSNLIVRIYSNIRS